MSESYIPFLSMDKNVITAMVSALTCDHLAQLKQVIEMEQEHREYQQQINRETKCACGAGFCKDDNLHYPCVCDEMDELPF